MNSILEQAKPRFCAGAPNLRGSALAGKVKPRHFDNGVPRNMLRRGKLRLLRAKGADSGVVFFSRKIAVERVSENTNRPCHFDLVVTRLCCQHFAIWQNARLARRLLLFPKISLRCDFREPCLLPEWRNLARCVSVDNIYNKEKRGGGSSFLRAGPAPQRRRRGGAKAGARKNAKPHISFEQKERVRKKGGKRAQNAAVFREKFCRAY